MAITLRAPALPRPAPAVTRHREEQSDDAI
jgi:hypothetical protein